MVIARLVFRQKQETPGGGSNLVGSHLVAVLEGRWEFSTDSQTACHDLKCKSLLLMARLRDGRLLQSSDLNFRR